LSHQQYGETWPENDPLGIERHAVLQGGEWVNASGVKCGQGLHFHWKRYMSLLWPAEKWHRWNELIHQSVLKNKFLGLMGPASSGKTHEAAKIALASYWLRPNATTVLLSSTEGRSLELKLFGQLKTLFRQATDVHPGRLAGHIIEHKMMMTTDGREVEGRSFQNGIVCIPCMVNHRFVGLGKYVGIKNEWVILLADEAQHMEPSFLDAVSNLNKNVNFQMMAMGNPKDRLDAFGIFCEPRDEDGGWDKLDDTEKTKTWRTKFHDGLCINLVGTDSPNYDVGPDAKVPFPFLITRKSIEEDLAYYQRQSFQFQMMNLGMMPHGTLSRTVITRELCRQFGASEPAVWAGSGRTKVAGLDAAYGNVGGDRCVFTEMHFGNDRDGLQIVEYIGQPVIIPVSIRLAGMPEDQIATTVKALCETRGIAPSNVFFDSTGRGTLMASFARLWSTAVEPVEFGGNASDRPVAVDSKKTCREHYSKFVSELWYTVRYCIEAGQMRGLPDDVIREGCLREWMIVAGNKIEIEPKAATKLRMGKSPDLFDSLVVAVEGARRRGFKINKLTVPTKGGSETETWLERTARLQKELHGRKQLGYPSR
jgi:hypothetical protein